MTDQDALYRELHERIEALISQRQELLDSSIADLEQSGLMLAKALGAEIRSREEIRQRLVPAFVEKAAWEKTEGVLRSLSRSTSEYSEALARAAQGLAQAPG